MFFFITHFIAFCLGAWACSAVLLPAKKGAATTDQQSHRTAVTTSSGGINPAGVLNQLGATSQQVFTPENMKQMQNLTGQLMQQLPQMMSALGAQKGSASTGLTLPQLSPQSQNQDPAEAALKKQMEEINRTLGVQGITETEVRSLLDQEHLDPEQKKILEQFLELSRKISEMKP